MVDEAGADFVLQVNFSGRQSIGRGRAFPSADSSHHILRSEEQVTWTHLTMQGNLDAS
jgi:hypothetical protein